MEAKQGSWLPALLTYALLAAMVAGQCQLVPGTNDINLRQWTNLNTETVDAGFCLASNWVYPPGVDNTVEQRTNTCGPTNLVSDFTISSTDIIRGTLTGFSLGAGSDDDYIGYNIGMNCGASASPTACSGDSVSIVWGAGFSNANPGLCFSRRSFPGIGVCPWGCVAGFPDDPGCGVSLGTYLNNVDACRDPNNRVTDPGGSPLPLGPSLTGLPVYANPAAFHGAALGGSDRFCGDFALPLGWALDRDYDIIIQFTPTRLRVFVDFVKVIDYSTIEVGDPQMSGQGRITLMNNSQGNVRYSSMQILDSGTDQCSDDPWEYVLPVETCGAGTTLVVEWGDNTPNTVYPVNSNQNVAITHIFASTPNGFYEVTATLFDDLGAEVESLGLIAFILDQPSSVLEAKTNGQCGFPKTCANDGEIFVSGLGGGVSPYNLLFQPGGSLNNVAECSGETGCNIGFSGLPDGTYTMDVDDSNGCAAEMRAVQLFSSTVSVTSIAETSCGNIDLTAFSTCEPVTYAWSTSDGSGLNPTAEDQSGLSPGTYNVVITDPNGCSNSASISVGFGITNVFANDVFYMYIPRDINWTNFVRGTVGSVVLDCPSSTTVVFSGDLSRTTTAVLTPQGIIPEDNCVVRITGVSGCSVSVGPVTLCAHTGVGGARC